MVYVLNECVISRNVREFADRFNSKRQSMDYSEACHDTPFVSSCFWNWPSTWLVKPKPPWLTTDGYLSRRNRHAERLRDRAQAVTI
jgi:hypothetical protein